MSIFQAIILGIVQGLTEFLPISSSAHLVLIPFLLNWQFDPAVAFSFNILVQVGTLLGVITYFWKEILTITVDFVRGLIQRKPFATDPSRQGWLLFLATLPAGVIGFLIKDAVAAVFASPAATAIFLLGTAILLAAAETFRKRQTRQPSSVNSALTWKDALAMGFGQALAVFPGISRSGATITAGMLRNLDRPTAARFSFLMSIPVMVAAGIFASLEMSALPDLGALLLPVAAGFIASAITGYLSIAWLLRYLTGHSLVIFSVYCAAAGIINLIIFILR
jgi:undecaprenyl-diphosphatase